MAEVIPASVAERMRLDVINYPAYALRILECKELGIDPASDDLAMEAARQLKLRRELRLADDAGEEQVKQALQRRAEAEYRWLRNRDMG